ncbi:MAG TPA: hypothetical protein VEZ12_08530 [Herpetosiphonaceae bacterium]|nr:hypothetical protein [Herpetosiphonaceae bacterium]
MKLPLEQVARFYRIWFPLLNYVNAHRQILPSFPMAPGEESIAPSDAHKLRTVLWADDALREQFVAENPASLPPADLDLVASWQHRLAGNFYIFRYLKRHTVFLSTTTPVHAYGVLGLASSIEEIAGPYLPVYVDAVLLPWEDEIIYDSLLSPYALYFGSGIRASLNDAYRDAKEREGIITRLLPPTELAEPEEQRKEIRARNAKVLAAFRRELAKTGLSLKMVEQHTANIADFAESALLAQSPPRALLDLTVADVRTYLEHGAAKPNAVSFRRFVQFLTTTGRLDYEQAEALRSYLRHA